MNRARFHVGLLTVYLLLTFLLSYPLISNLSTHVPGSELWAFDEYTFVWDIWWFKHALLVLQQSPLSNNYIFYPIGINLSLFTLTVFNGALALPLLAWLPLPLISNLITLFAFVGSAYGMFLLALDQLNVRASHAKLRRAIYLGAAVAGLVYAFATSKFVYAAIGHYNVVGTEWVPLYVLYLIRSLRRPSRRSAIMAGVFLALALYVEMFVAIFLGAVTLLYLCVLRPWRALGGPRVVSQLALMSGFALVMFAPVLVPVAREYLAADYTLQGWGGADRLSVDLLGFLSPSALNSWAGVDWNRELLNVIQGKGRFVDVNTVFLGYVTVALGVLGWAMNRGRAGVWGAGALIFALLAMGPLLQINGVSLFDVDGLMFNVPLPFMLLHYIPIVQANRVPNRFSIVIVLCLAMLVGFAFRGLTAALESLRTRLGWVGFPAQLLVAVPLAVLLLALLFEHLVVPLPLTDARVPAFYETLSRDTADYAILQLPLGWRNSFGTLGAEDTRVQYYQAIHHKRILAGNTSRNPPFKFDYFASLPIVSSLIALESYGKVSADQKAADRAYADEFVSFFDLRYVVANPAVPGRHPYDDTRAAALQYLLDVLPLDRIDAGAGVEVYRVRRVPPPPTLGIDFGEPTSRMYRGEGWDREEEISGARANWSNARSARVFVPVAAPADYRLSFSALPLRFSGAPPQTATLTVNGQLQLPAVELSPGWNTYALDVPAASVKPGMNELDFEFAYARAPREVLPSEDARTLSVAFDWLRWDAK
jgi:hypothetical protein